MDVKQPGMSERTGTRARRLAKRNRAVMKKRLSPHDRGARPADLPAFHLEQFLDALGKDTQVDGKGDPPPFNRLADGRMIVPLLLGVPRVCHRRRCHRAKTCTDPHAWCLFAMYNDIAARRWQRLDDDPAFRSQRWRQISRDAPARETRRPSCSPPLGT